MYFHIKIMFFFSFSYPSIFVIYETIPLMIIAALVVVGFSSRRKLFCTSPNLISSIGNPTPFCIITGQFGAEYDKVHD